MVLPGVRGEIAVAVTLTVIAALRTFDLVYITTSGGPGRPAFRRTRSHRAFELGQVGSAVAIGVCLTVLIFVITLGVNRLADRGTA